MKILVFSDSHSEHAFMERTMEAVRPDCVLHLGDFLEDGETISMEYPEVRFYQVPGNCDAYRNHRDLPEILQPVIGGVRFYMTHGHLHHVKSMEGILLRAAEEAKADIVLYGHTHMPVCYQEESGLWVMNPGAAGRFCGTAGLIEISDGRIKSCRILR